MSEETKKDYVVLADGQSMFEFNERGDMTHKARFKKGDTVSLTEGQAAGLLRHGGIREAGEAPRDADGPDEGAGTTEAVGGSGETFTDEDLPFDEDGVKDLDDDGNIVEDEDDDYESMEYGDLQALAKSRTGNGGGSKADLIERLRKHDSES